MTGTRLQRIWAR